MMGKGRVFYNETGQPRRMLGVSTEVTARKRAEAEALQRQREAEVLAQLAQTLNTSLELDMVLQRVAEGATRAVRQRAGTHHAARAGQRVPGQSLSGGLSTDALHGPPHRTWQGDGGMGGRDWATAADGGLCR